MKEKISEEVYELVQDYRTKSIKLLEGLEFNQYETIKRIYFYQNDKYQQCTDENAIFWQMVTQYVPHFAKLIDFDPKDFRVFGEGDANYLQSWITNKLYKNWVKKDGFDVDIDDLTKAVSSFGSFVFKSCPKGNVQYFELCDLRNLAFDPTLKTIRGKDIVELHYLSDEEIKEKQGAWDNIKDLCENAEEVNGKKEIWETCMWVEKGEGENEVYEYKHVIGAGRGDKEVIAFEEKIDPEDSPYWDVHLDDYKGRWLRVGMYERCFPEQERANAVVNQNAAATEIASLLLLRTTDGQTTGNVLQSAVNGQIINSSDLQQIGIDNRAFTVLLNELTKIEQQVQKKLMLPDIATGDNMPSGTPFRSTALITNSYKSAFKQIRTRVASPIKNILLDQILPSLVKVWNKGTMLEIAESEQDAKMYDEALVKKAKIMALNEATAQFRALTDEELGIIEEEAGRSIKTNGRKIEVEKGFFNFDYGLTMDPTGETYDKAVQNDAIIQALTMSLQNPAVMEIPAFNQLLENNGITPFKMTPEMKQSIMQNAVGQQPPQMPQMPTDKLSQMVDTQ